MLSLPAKENCTFFRILKSHTHSKKMKKKRKNRKRKYAFLRMTKLLLLARRKTNLRNSYFLKEFCYLLKIFSISLKVIFLMLIKPNHDFSKLKETKILFP